MSTVLSEENIRKELEAIWAGLARESTSAGVLRASGMTLLVATQDDRWDDDCRAQFDQVIMRFPCRAVVVRRNAHVAGHPQAHTLARCWLPSSGRRQICCEQVEILVPPGQLPAIVPLLRGIAVPDLPVVLYLRDWSLEDLPVFDSLLRFSWRAVVDTAGSDASGAIQLWRALGGACRGFSDLSWTRLTPWRQVLEEVFEGAEWRALSPSIERATVEIGPGPLSPAACLLAAWIADSLGWMPDGGSHSSGGTRRQIQFKRVRTVGEKPVVRPPDNGLCGLRLAARGGKIRLATREPGVIEAITGQTVRRWTFSPRTESRLLAEELAILSQDAVFCRVLSAVLLQPPGLNSGLDASCGGAAGPND